MVIINQPPRSGGRAREIEGGERDREREGERVGGGLSAREP